MIKLLICLFSGIAIALFTLNLRHQELELRHQNAELHDKIKSQQARLWNEQLQIAIFTGPNAITQTVKSQRLEMVPQFAVEHVNWTELVPDGDKPKLGH